MPSLIRISKSGFTGVYPPSSGAGSFDSYVDSVASARHIPLNRKRPGIHKYPQQVHLCTRNADADVLAASPLVSSTVDWIQPSRHVVPKSRVAIATPSHRTVEQTRARPWRLCSNSRPLQISKMHELEVAP